MTRARRSMAVLACVVACHTAQAGRSSLGDASAVADRGDCEAETVFERVNARGDAPQRDAALRLACGIGWQTELEAAWARQRSGDARTQALALEAKTTLRERSDERIGWSISVGIGAERQPGGSWRRSDYSLALEATRQLGATWLVEAALGSTRERAARRNSTLWTVAVEHALSDALELRAELDGDDRGRPQLALGLRYTLWPDLLQLRLSRGVRSGPQRERRTSIGLQFEF